MEPIDTRDLYLSRGHMNTMRRRGAFFAGKYFEPLGFPFPISCLALLAVPPPLKWEKEKGGIGRKCEGYEFPSTLLRRRRSRHRKNAKKESPRSFPPPSRLSQREKKGGGEGGSKRNPNRIENCEIGKWRKDPGEGAQSGEKKAALHRMPFPG